jgi:hypothetical protein
MNRTVFSLSLAALSLWACGDRNAPGPEAAQAPAAETSAAVPAPSDAPVGPISSRGEVVPGAPSTPAPMEDAGLAFDLPKGWVSHPSSSSMRIAEAVIEGPGGPAQLAVFYFGPGGGGPVDANIERWVGQMEGAAQPKPEVFEVNGYRVTWVDVHGTLKPSQMGSGPDSPQADSRLLGAVVEGAGGPWFFKATGPDSTLGPQRDAFVAMLKSVRAKAPASA